MTSALHVDEEAWEAAREAGLRYVSDNAPGIQRRRAGRGFSYIDSTGSAVRGEADLARIRALAIPPAWTQVWICAVRVGHIQATGRDAKGRKQYRYHADWRAHRDETKFARMEAFGAALPLIRERASRDLGARGLPRDKVLATVVQLLDRTLVRVGNEEYARQNGSFGLTTLRDRHVTIEGAHLQFHFRGKSGKDHVVDLTDPRLATIVKRCQELPGQELFHFRDGAGALHPVESTDVNAYLRETTGEHFSAKDFRTWHGTLLAACSLARARTEGRVTERRVIHALAEVAARLGNTPAVCRRSYVHPVIVEHYLRGQLARSFDPGVPRSECETALLRVLRNERRGRSARGDSPPRIRETRISL